MKFQPKKPDFMKGAHGRSAQSSARETPQPVRPPVWNSSQRQKHPKKDKQPNALKRIMDGWWDRLLGAVSEGSFSGQEEEYAPHRTSQDYIWNTAGLGAWAMVFPLLTIVITQLVNVDEAGMFSLAFVTATLLMIIANYGVRTYQVSDVEEQQSFIDYRVNRWLTCIVMMLIGWVFCQIRGYDSEMLYISMYVYLYKMVDGLADVYEGRLQQMDKLYLAGISQMIRSVLVFLVFTILLLFTRNLVVASLAMAIAAFVSFILVTLPLAFLETPKSKKFSLRGVGMLFKNCFPLFIALFLYAFIDNMPKFMMDGVLTYDNQLYFNALYFPAQAILMIVGFIYKPLLVRMSNAWVDVTRRKKFDLFILAMVGIIAVVTVIMVLFMAWIGIPIMSFLYGIDFEQFRNLSYIMLAAGGITGGIDFLYQVITIMRRQGAVTKLYLIAFGFALFIPLLLIHYSGLAGAAVGYLIVMCFLMALLLLEYISVRVDYKQHPENDPTLKMAQERASSGGTDSPGDAMKERPVAAAAHAAAAGPQAGDQGHLAPNPARAAAQAEIRARQAAAERGEGVPRRPRGNGPRHGSDGRR